MDWAGSLKNNVATFILIGNTKGDLKKMPVHSKRVYCESGRTSGSNFLYKSCFCGIVNSCSSSSDKDSSLFCLLPTITSYQG